jgi:UDP-N-acetylmuramoyl-tripeptide--D-alanyl-D-alanine ligase
MSIQLTRFKFAESVQGQLIAWNQAQLEDLPLNFPYIDSRHVGLGDYFFALPGQNVNGHNFVGQAFAKGAALVVIEASQLEFVQNTQHGSGVLCVVPSVEKALVDAAIAWRSQFTYPVVALTGSSGKTTVRYMIHQVLSAQHSVVGTEGNLNNHLGVPLSLLKMQDNHEFGVFELGASAQKEIQQMSSWVKADVALITNAGSAHLEGFGGYDGIVKGKGEIYETLKPNGIGIVNLDSRGSDYWLSLLKHHKTISFSTNSAYPKADLTLVRQFPDLDQVRLEFKFEEQVYEVAFSLLGEHQCANALAVIGVCLGLGLSMSEILAGFSQIKPVKGRLMPIKKKWGLILDDCYNANPASVKAAINFLSQFTEHRRILVLGDMLELGEESSGLHAEVGAWAQEKKIDNLIGFGQQAAFATRAFNLSDSTFQDIEKLSDYIKNQIQEFSMPTVVLVKGSRGMKLERLVDSLSQF